MIFRWNWEFRPHLITDAAFGSLKDMERIAEWGGFWTTSMPVNNNSNLWNVLSYNCSTDSWRAAVNEDGWVASCHTVEAEKSHNITHQQILSNGFDAEISEKYVNVDSIEKGNKFSKYLLIY